MKMNYRKLKTEKQIFKAIILFFAAFGSYLYAQDSTTESSIKVLLVYENTNFKKGLIESINELLKKDNIFSKVIEHSNGALDQQNPADYKAIFISNSGVNSMVRPWVADWLKKNNEYSKKIILHTTQTKDWVVKVNVDAVTSASKKKETNKLAVEYVQMIKNRITSD